MALPLLRSLPSAGSAASDSVARLTPRAAGEYTVLKAAPPVRRGLPPVSGPEKSAINCFKRGRETEKMRKLALILAALGVLAVRPAVGGVIYAPPLGWDIKGAHGKVTLFGSLSILPAQIGWLE